MPLLKNTIKPTIQNVKSIQKSSTVSPKVVGARPSNSKKTIANVNQKTPARVEVKPVAAKSPTVPSVKANHEVKPSEAKPTWKVPSITTPKVINEPTPVVETSLNKPEPSHVEVH
jgi:hypothetical protein